MRAAEARGEAERRRLGLGTAKAARLAHRRALNAAKPYSTDAEGRLLLARENRILDSAGPAFKLLARAVDDIRPVIAMAIDAYACDVHEFGFETEAARRWAIQSALFSALAMFLVGQGAQLGTTAMTGTRSSARDGHGVSASIRLAGFKDVVSLGALCSAKAQYAAEMAWRAEDRARLEARQRERRGIVPMLSSPAATADDLEAASSGEAKDELEAGCLEGEEHGAAASEESPLSGAVADDLARADAPELAGPPLEEPEWCSHRKRLVPRSIANTPQPAGSDGPDWVKRVAVEDAAIARWEEARSQVLRRHVEHALGVRR